MFNTDKNESGIFLFLINEKLYAIPVSEVCEIRQLEKDDVFPIPGSKDKRIVGLINYESKIIPLLDIFSCCEYKNQYCIVLSGNGLIYAFCADRILGVFSHDSEKLNESEPTDIFMLWKSIGGGIKIK